MRLDIYLFESNLSKSRSYASELIKKGFVTVDGKLITKPSFEIDDLNPQKVEVNGSLFSFVGRGGVKLEAALNSFEISVEGYTCIDVGASTGGFTDCLLKRGASKVFAVDSGHGQLDATLASDKRVVNMEGFNARDLSPYVIPCQCDIAVCDLSFISQTLVLPGIFSVLKDGGLFITLVKPQFECGRSAVGKGGIVKDKKYHEEAKRKVEKAAEECGFKAISSIVSPIKGGDGNTEFLTLFKKQRKDI